MFETIKDYFKALKEDKKREEKLLTSSQFLSIIIATTLVTSICSNRNKVTIIGRQSGFIAFWLAAIYPAIVFYMYSFIIKKYPNLNLIQINSWVLGKIMGAIFNLLIFSMIFVYATCNMVEIIMLSTQTVFWYLNNNQILTIILCVGMLCSYYSIKGHSKTLQILLFIIAVAMIANFNIFKYGNIRNLTPVFVVPLKNIFMAGFYAIYPISGFEIFVIHSPLLKNKGDYKKISVKFVVYLTIILSTITLLNQYYWGVDMLNCIMYPIQTVLSLLQVPLFTDSTFLFITIILIVSMACFSVIFKSCHTVLRNIFSRVNSSILMLILAVAFFIFVSNFWSMADLEVLILYIYYPLIVIFLLNLLLLLIFICKRGEKQ